jgi:ubiquinone biosynthesis protein Coq4
MNPSIKTFKKNSCLELILRIHETISNTSAKILGPIVFNIGTKEKGWNLTTASLLQFPMGTVGKALGEFLSKRKMEPLVRAEYHDVHHVLFDFSTSFKDEVALQFFLRGNGKTSLASLGTSIGAWCIMPTQWSYFRNSYKRGKKCADISNLNLKALLHEDLDKIKSSLFKNEFRQS